VKISQCIFLKASKDEVSDEDFKNLGVSLISLLVKSGLSDSNSKARRLIKDGGARINDIQVLDENARVGMDTINNEKIFIILERKA
jgi:tyrosyl-tRNA synthetase